MYAREGVMRKRRAEALSMIAARGLTLTSLANGKARITGRGVDLLIADIGLLTPLDVDGNTRQAYI